MMNNELKHYGILGMKWGVRKSGVKRSNTSRDSRLRRSKNNKGDLNSKIKKIGATSVKLAMASSVTTIGSIATYNMLNKSGFGTINSAIIAGSVASIAGKRTVDAILK